MNRTTLPRFARLIVTQGGDGGGEAPVNDGEPTQGADKTGAPDAGEQDTDESDDGDDGEPEQWDHARALAKIRKANAEAKAQRERAKAAEAKAATLDEVTRERDALRAQANRYQIAAETGLDPFLASRLQGDTLEEMREDAQALLEHVAPLAPPSQAPRSGQSAPRGPQTPQVETSDQIAARMFATRN